MHMLKHVHPLVLNLKANRKLSTCRKTAVLFRKLENSDKRPKNIRMCIWVKNILSGGTISRKSSAPGSNVNARAKINQPRGRGNFEKGGHSPISSKGESSSKQLVSSSKNEGGNRPVINMKALNSFIPHSQFKMEGLHLIKDLLRQNYFMCKLNLKDAYFCLPLHRKHQKFIRFQWKGNIYEFFCLFFGPGPAPQTFTKLSKIPIAILRWIQIRIIIYLDDMLLMSHTINGLEIATDTFYFLLQGLSFVINLQKPVLVSLQKIEFLGLEIDSVRMTLTLPQEKVKKLRLKCQKLISNPKTTLWVVTSLVGSLCSTAQAVLPAML